MTKRKLKARENSRNLPPNIKVSGFRQTAKRKQGVFEKTTGHTRLSLQFKYFWITILYFAINSCLKIHLFRTKIECLPSIIPSFCYFCRHPVLHRADTPHVWLYTVSIYTIFNRDLINHMDHMRISGNEPSSLILSQTKELLKLKAMPLKCSKLKPKCMV